MRSGPLTAFGSLALAMICGALPAAADPGPDYSGFGIGKFLTYTNGPAASGTIETIPKLTIAFAPGKTYPIEVDTGSTAIVVSADQVPTLQGTPCDECLEYSSSGRIYSGVWVSLPVTITGGNGAAVTTTPIRVLAVTRRTTCRAKGNCTSEPNPSGVDIMGVGFAREHDHMPESTPDTNPFLNIADPSHAPLRRGYVVTKTGVHVGLTRSNTHGDFHFVKLAGDPDFTGEWEPTPACVTVRASAAASCGSALVDTGVTSMFLTLPRTAFEGATGPDGQLAPGTQVDIGFPGTDGSTEAAYGFNVGRAGDPVAPSTVNLHATTPTRGPFVNTGVRLLNRFDVLFDADGGFFAFRARPAGE